MKNTTLLIIKPDAVKKKNIGKIITLIEKENLIITKIKTLKLTKHTAEDFYIEHKNKNFYEELITFITSDMIIAIIIEGVDAIIRTRELVGHTDYKQAKEGKAPDCNTVWAMSRS